MATLAAAVWLFYPFVTCAFRQVRTRLCRLEYVTGFLHFSIHSFPKEHNSLGLNKMIRESSKDDIPQLASHHKKMFQEIWMHKGETLAIDTAAAIEKAYALKLHTELDTGICKCWVSEIEGNIVASGAVTLGSYVPSPVDLSSRGAYMHSIYTEKKYRNQKHAQLIIERAIDYCKANGIHRIMLQASLAGRSLYKKLGFTEAPDTMRLIL